MHIITTLNVKFFIISPRVLVNLEQQHVILISVFLNIDLFCTFEIINLTDGYLPVHAM